jgi:hypothetical protein
VRRVQTAPLADIGRCPVSRTTSKPVSRTYDCRSPIAASFAPRICSSACSSRSGAGRSFPTASARSLSSSSCSVRSCAAERRRGLRFTEFELRHFAAVRKELNAEYQTSIARPCTRPAKPRFQQISALTFIKGGRRLSAGFARFATTTLLGLGRQNEMLSGVRHSGALGNVRDGRAASADGTYVDLKPPASLESC